MNPALIMQLALEALQAILNTISEIKAQSGMNDEAILAQAQTVTGANDALYATLTAALKPPSGA